MLAVGYIGWLVIRNPLKSRQSMLQIVNKGTRRSARVLLLLILCVPASAEELSFVPQGETEPEPYLIEKPASSAPGKRHALIVYLHGRGQGHKFQWLSQDFRQFRQRAAARGYFVLIPHLGTDQLDERAYPTCLDRATRSGPTELPDRPGAGTFDGDEHGWRRLADVHDVPQESCPVRFMTAAVRTCPTGAWP
jgi:hypothetical protein